MLRAARVSRHLTRGEYVAPASVRASEQVVGSGWWWVVVLGYQQRSTASLPSSNEGFVRYALW